jgi:hypothetical protein|tara:strand:+ start:631 stop:771 length:141 start_codon:yes stop_codon:yes gene_type:complete
MKWGLTEGSQKVIEAPQKPMTLVKSVSKIYKLFGNFEGLKRCDKVP